MSSRNVSQPIKISQFWGVAHGVNDWVAGYILAHQAIFISPQKSYQHLIFYAILAFGGQLPLAMWLDVNKKWNYAGNAGLLLLMSGCTFFDFYPTAAVIVAGISSAMIHVVGGSICLFRNQDSLTPVSIFAAPGIAGLALGGICGPSDPTILWLALPVLAVLYYSLQNTYPAIITRKNEVQKTLEKHDLAMIILLLVICLRSLVYDMVQHFSMQFEYGLLVTGVSAAVGKLMAGFFADKVGWKKWIFCMLPSACLLLIIGHDNLIAFAAGVACLQSTVPISIFLMASCLPQYPSVSIAFSLGVPVALAGLPLYATNFLQTCITESKLQYILFFITLFISATLLLIFYRKSLKQLLSN
jgi:hypothetical protein